MKTLNKVMISSILACSTHLALADTSVISGSACRAEKASIINTNGAILNTDSAVNNMTCPLPRIKRYDSNINPAKIVNIAVNLYRPTGNTGNTRSCIVKLINTHGGVIAEHLVYMQDRTLSSESQFYRLQATVNVPAGNGNGAYIVRCGLSPSGKNANGALISSEYSGIISVEYDEID